MTNFQQVVEFNNTFDIPVNDKPVLDIFEKDPKLVKYRMDLIREEVAELEKAVSENDMKETLDALTDILYVVYGMGCTLGLDLDKSFKIVHESNMSKSCSSLEEAAETCNSYKGDVRYDSPEFKLSKNNKYIIFNKSTKKILKNINYKPANFDEMLKIEKN